MQGLKRWNSEFFDKKNASLGHFFSPQGSNQSSFHAFDLPDITALTISETYRDDHDYWIKTLANLIQSIVG
jgi:hypothetical protein